MGGSATHTAGTYRPGYENRLTFFATNLSLSPRVRVSATKGSDQRVSWLVSISRHPVNLLQQGAWDLVGRMCCGADDPNVSTRETSAKGLPVVGFMVVV